MVVSKSKGARHRFGQSPNESFDNLLPSTPSLVDDSSDTGTYVPLQPENSVELETIRPRHTEFDAEHRALPVQQAPKGTRSNYLPLSSTEVDSGGGGGDVLWPNLSTSYSQDNGRPFWTPYTLQWPFLSATLLVTLILLLAVVFLLTYSATQHGLGPDNESSAVLFGWRFAPTLLTVLYAVLTLMILKDAQRTEPFAQMSHPAGAVSESSVCRKENFWWIEIYESLRKSRNHGRINYYILATVSLHTINTLLINTLSSSLLQSQDVSLQSMVPFTRYQSTREDPIAMAADNFVYFDTISNILQNSTTSSWLTEKYAVIPFWPSSIQPDVRLLPTGNIQQWSASTSVFSVDLDCEPMKINYSAWSKNFPNNRNRTISFKSFLLTDSQGCQVGLNFQASEQLLFYGGGSWFVPPNFTYTSWTTTSLSTAADGQNGYHNSTEQCTDRQIIFASNFSATAPNNLTQAFSCLSTFYFAEMQVEVSISPAAITVNVDDGKFNASRSLLAGSSILDEARFETAYTNANWSSTLFSPNPYARNFGGPLALLAALYDFDSARLISSDSVVPNAKKIKQRFLGEMILASVSRNPQSSQAGQVIEIERRVVVNVPIAVSLIALLSISSILMAFVLYASRKRSLNVFSDPTSIAAAIRLIDGNSTLYTALRTAGQDKRADASQAFQNMLHLVVNGRLHTRKTNTVIENPHVNDDQKSDDWRSFVIRRSGSLLLTILLALVFAVTLALFVLAQTTGLYETAFTYQAVLGQAGNGFEFVPFSIVPTFIAVIISMWWTSFGEAFQRLQAFVTMAETTVPVIPTISLSYTNMTPVESVVRALRNKHWMIAVVSAAALLTQVLTVSMSAVWQRAGGIRDGSVELTRTLEPRGLPFEYNFNLGTSAAGGSPVGVVTFSNLFGHLTQNWLYSATLQLIYNGSEPGWSTDGWSFVPVDLSPVRSSDLYRSTPSNSSSDRLKEVNVSLTTPALRGTLDCSPILSTSNLSSWLTQYNLNNASVWNVTQNPTDWQKGFEINKLLELGAEALFSRTSILTKDRGAVMCCANSTSGPEGTSTIGYWSNNHHSGLSYDFDSSSGPYPRNLTIKWIIGDAHPRHYLMNQTWSSRTLGISGEEELTHFIWPAAPQMSALNCRPRIQWTNASITVDMTTRKIHNYTIVDPVEDFDWPWTDVYASHKINSPGVNAAGSNPEQMTLSFGVLFQDAMMVAADLRKLWPGVDNYPVWSEDLDDKAFNFRLPEQGLNADLMSYAMYQLAGGNLSVLTNHTSLTQLGDKVFSTFFQHFVSYNLSSGGWAMQPIGATLNPDLGPAYNNSPGEFVVHQPQNVTFTSDTRVTARVAIAVEVLEMSPLAVYITLVTLLVLVVVTCLAYITGFRHVHVLLRHDFEDLTSVFRTIYASEKLREWVQTHSGAEGGKQRPTGGEDVPHIHLGSFATAEDEHETWGIEMVADGREPKRTRDGQDVNQES